jgi:small subunit ribosomal protein S1
MPVAAETIAFKVVELKKAVKKINSNVEKTTLGDLDALAALKSQLESK